MGLFWRMIKRYFATGGYVILDSGFCVLKGLIQLRKKGMFACAVIKKRRYWPFMMEDNFGRLEGGETDAIQGIVYGDIYNL